MSYLNDKKPLDNILKLSLLSLFCGFVILVSFKIDFAYAQNEAFDPCKYAERGMVIDVTAPKPDIFLGIKRINVFGSAHYEDPLKNNPLFDSKNLSSLAACTIERYLTTPPAKTSSIPVKILDYPRIPFDWPEVKEEGNLIVWVNVNYHDGAAYENLFDDGIVTVSAHYYRLETHDIEELQYQCDQAFPYVEDPEKLHKILTLAMSHCLKKPYRSGKPMK